MNLADTILYQFYPLTLPGVPRLNPEDNIPVNRIQQLEAWIPHLQKLGVTAVYLSPVFQSGSHGYDTIDYYTVDGRLGSNGDFAGVCDSFHKAGIAVILDGVFNHTGRDFHAFRDVRANGKNSRYAGWYYINWEEDSPYHDGFSYEGWEGCMDLVKLNLENEEVAEHIFGAVKMWSQRFRIDGLRLDVAYSLNRTFLEKLHRVCKGLPSLFSDMGFPLIGETIHSRDYDIVQEHLCDSCTNYECYKGLTSALNSDNLFEIEHSLERLFGAQPWCLYTGKNLFSFADNHDVPRAYTALADKRKIYAMYAILYSMPGIPCVYYGSEYGAEGNKGHGAGGDDALRPSIGEIDKNKCPELTAFIRKLNAVRSAEPAFAYGTYDKCVLNNKYMCFKREHAGERIYCAFNISDGDVTVRVEECEGTDLLTGEVRNLNDIYLPPFAVKLFKKNG